MEAGAGGDAEPGAGGDQLPAPRDLPRVPPLHRQQGRAASPAHPQPGVDLDSEAVDWDINTTLYTPLPEPKIMQIAGAGDGGLDTVSILQLRPENCRYLSNFKPICTASGCVLSV